MIPLKLIEKSKPDERDRMLLDARPDGLYATYHGRTYHVKRLLEYLEKKAIYPE